MYTRVYLLLVTANLVFLQASPFAPHATRIPRPTSTLCAQSAAVATVATHEKSTDDFLLSNSSMAKFMPKWPAIVTYTAVKGWTNDTTMYLQRAVEDVLELNPILTGRVYQKRVRYCQQGIFPSFPKVHTELRVEPGYFDKEHFLEIVDAPSGMRSLKDMNCTTALQHVQEIVIPYMNIRCESTEEDIKKKLPLFCIKVVRFPDDTACIGLKMSHCLGDGVTFFYLYDQIMYLLNYEAMKHVNARAGTEEVKMRLRNHLINWDHPAKASFECYPDTFSLKDRRNAYGWPFYLGIFRNFRRLINPTYKRLMVLRRDKIDEVKQEYQQKYPAGTRISANDLMTAGLCQSCESTDIFSFPFNQRGRRPDLMGHMTAGYLCSEIPFPRDDALEPIDVRKIVSQGYYFEKDQLPIGPFLCGRNGRISNFASVQTKHLFRKGPSGIEITCHCMPVNFFEIFPIDVAMMFPVDQEHIGVMHNFDKFHDTEILDRMSVFTMEPDEKESTS